MKEYDATSTTKVNIFMNAHLEDYVRDQERKIEDNVVEITASVAKYALNHNVETTLQYQGYQNVKIEARDMASFPELLKDMVTFSPKGDLAFSELISQASKRFDYGSFIVLVTPKIDQGIMNVLNGLSRRAFKISLILVHGDGDSRDQLNLLSAQGVKVYDIQEDDDVKRSLEVF